MRYIWDGDHLVAETDAFGNTLATFEYAGDRLLGASHAIEGEIFYLSDALGSPVAVSKPDGSIAARYGYDAWGNLRTQAGVCFNPFEFAGYEKDAATGLLYAKARYYDAELGRFSTEDPFPGEALEPLSLHPYLYAYANPAKYLDPDGRCVGSLLETPFCQAIARTLSRLIVGDPVRDAEIEIERRNLVLEGRRRFIEETGRAPGPKETVAWPGTGQELTADGELLDARGQILPDQAEWVVAGASIGARFAIAGARAAGASSARQVGAAILQLGDEAVGQAAGISPGDIHAVARLARRGSASIGSRAATIAEATDSPGHARVARGSWRGELRTSAIEAGPRRGAQTGSDFLTEVLPEGKKSTRWRPEPSRVADSQRHHLISNPIADALEEIGIERETVLALRNNPALQRMSAPGGHAGYERRHREYDDYMVDYIRSKGPRGFRISEFLKEVETYYSKGEAASRIPGVVLGEP